VASEHDYFTEIFGVRRGSGREDVPDILSCPVPVSVMSRDVLAGGGFSVADARPQLREMPSSLWHLYHHLEEAFPQTTLGTQLCLQHGDESRSLLGHIPPAFILQIDREALGTFLAAEYPALLSPDAGA